MTLRIDRRLSRNGFSRIEFLVVIFLVITMSTLAFVALRKSRTEARTCSCQNVLRDQGIAFYSFADIDPNSAFCTGAYDYLRDGDVTKYSFVADGLDAVGIWSFKGDKLPLCLENAAAGNESLNDLIGHKEQVNHCLLPEELQKRALSGLCEDFELDFNGDQRADSGSIPGATPERIAIVDEITAKGYLTNYVPSWFLVRTDFRMKTDDAGNEVINNPTGLKQLGSTAGPLTILKLDSSPVLSNLIPLIADGTSVTQLSHSLKSRNLKQNSALVATMTAGPVRYNPETDQFVSFQDQQIIVPEDLTQYQYRPFCQDKLPTTDQPHGNGGMDGHLWMQDISAWGTVHQVDKTWQCNVLMADGSVKSFQDQNGDRLLNPGFNINENSQTGYTNGKTEVMIIDFYTGPTLAYQGSYPKGTFE